MGDKIRTGQRTSRRRGREGAREELGRPNLFTRPDLMATEYPVLPAGGERIAVGDVLNIYAGQQPDRVNFARGTRLVGYSTGEPAARLRQAMVETGQEVIRARVVAVSPFGVGATRIEKEDGGEQSHRASA